MISTTQIKWGKYKTYEGPVYYGNKKFVPPNHTTENDNILSVITATEGGHWNAVNMYDRCICTVGLIQWCEAGQYSVSDMLGHIVNNKGIEYISNLNEIMNNSNVEFKKNARNRWRFFFKDDRGEVDRKIEQQQLFLLNSNGNIGSFDSESKKYATLWASSLASVYENQNAIESQRDFTVPKLKNFALPFARHWIDTAPNTSAGKAFIAAYLSFAANNPLKANNALKESIESTSETPFSINWLVHVLSGLTFKPGFTIYPERYNKIRPVLEKNYKLDLPDFAEQLKDVVFVNTAEIQQILFDLGYELGNFGSNNNGVDGRWGSKSQEALLDFQKKNDLHPDGWPDEKTNDKLKRANEALQKIKDDHGGAIPAELANKAMSLVALTLSKSASSYFNSVSKE